MSHHLTAYVHPTAYVESGIVVGALAHIKPLAYVTKHVPPFVIASGNPATWKKLVTFRDPTLHELVRGYYMIYYNHALKLSDKSLQKYCDDFYEEIKDSEIPVMEFTGTVYENNKKEKKLMRVV